LKWRKLSKEKWRLKEGIILKDKGQNCKNTRLSVINKNYKNNKNKNRNNSVKNNVNFLAGNTTIVKNNKFTNISKINRELMNYYKLIHLLNNIIETV
jgi:hypothetical protein